MLDYIKRVLRDAVMSPKGAECPYCHSTMVQILADRDGTVGWCQNCHRSWIPQQLLPVSDPEDSKKRMTG